MSVMRTIEAGGDLDELVRDLVSGDASGRDVLAMYVDLDSHVPIGTRPASIDAALDEAERNAPDGRWGRLLEDLRGAFEAAAIDLGGARGLLVYGTSDGDATIVKLPTPVTTQVGFERGVPIRQLIAAIERERWLVLLCNRRSSRLLISSGTRMEELSWWQDDVEGQHDQGGWAQARMERNIEHQVQDHVRRTALEVMRLREEGLFGRLLVGTPRELRSLVESELDSETRHRVAGFVDVDVEHVDAREVERLVREHARARRGRQHAGLLDLVEERVARRTRAASGLDEVVVAARAAAIDTLVVSDGLRVPGHACPHGDWPAIRGGSCPLHDLELDPVADLVEVVLDMAIAADARVHTIPAGDEGSEGARLEGMGGIAALLRYEVPTGA